MSAPRSLAVMMLLLAFNQPAGAGLYYSGETQNELPSQWRGFLLDQRMLRSIAVPAVAGAAANPARVAYDTAAANLEKAARDRKLTADERADLGAVYVRL